MTAPPQGWMALLRQLRDLEPSGRRGQVAERFAVIMQATPVLARLVLVAALTGCAVLVLDQLLSSAEPLLVRLVATVSVVALVAVQMWYSTGSAGPRRGRAAVPVLVVQALLTLLPVAVGGTVWPGVPGLLVGTLLVALRAPTAVPLVAAVSASVVLLETVPGPLPQNLLAPVFVVVTSLVFGLVVAGLTALVGAVEALGRARAELEVSAAVRERARFAKDVHDLLGLGLVAVTLKCEVAARLITVDTAAAREQLDEVLVMARRALADVRSLSRGVDALSFEDELEAAYDTLIAVDVKVTVERCGATPAGRAGSVLAAALREGVTNVLRHSRPNWCTLVVRHDGDRARLEIENDGATRPPAEHVPGQGLGNLTQRAAELGGTAQHGPVGADGHRLTVEVPVAGD